MRPEIQQANNWDVTRHYLLTVTISCGSVCVCVGGMIVGWRRCHRGGRLLFAAGQLIVSVSLVPDL